MFILKKILFTILWLGISVGLFAGTSDIPVRPDPPRLVNDFTGLLAPAETQALESQLVAFDDSTSTQIVVVIVNDLKGYDVNQFAYTIGHSWQVGQKGKNNGIVLLVKPKTSDSRGQVSIQSGYGMEATVTDALSKRIIENEIIPQFRQNNYYGGIEAGVKAIMLASKGQYKAEPKKARQGSYGGLIIFLVIFIIFIIAAIGSRKQQYDAEHHSVSGSSLPWWLLMGTFMGSSFNNSSGGHWDNFSSGSDSFGGFGGGDFGGGGASGSW